MNNTNFSISFAFLAYNEKEIINSLNIINLVKRPQDEIVILFDITYDKQLYNECIKYVDIIDINPLNKDFATQKNKLIELCSKDYILNLDADEYISVNQLRLLYKILELNQNTDLFYFPRINTVTNITQEHINKWRWKISKNDNIKNTKNVKDLDDKFIKLLKSYNYIIHQDNDIIEYYEPLINYPDLQGRLWKNNGVIHWKNKVHEKLIGFKSISLLPVHIIHNKTINKQKEQNKFYSTI